MPIVGSDNNTWGSILNGYLDVAHNANGTAYTVTSITSSYTIANENPININEVILANASGGAITVTLPDATNTSFNTNIYAIKKTDTSSNIVTINTTSSQTIDGGLTALLLVPFVSVNLVSNGSDWLVI